MWTARCAIPAVWNVRQMSSAQSIIFYNKIWIICDAWNMKVGRFDTQVFVFNPALNKIDEVKCKYPTAWPEHLEILATDGIELYMWRTAEILQETSLELFKLNKKKMRWESIITLTRHGHFASVVVVDQKMYILERNSAESCLMLVRIDLEEKKVEEIVELRELFAFWNGFLTTNNNKFYLIEAIAGVRRVSQIIDGQLMVIHCDDKDNIFEPSMNYAQCSNPDENLFWYRAREFKTFTFDYSTLEWTEASNQQFDKKLVNCQSAVKLNSLVYLLVRKNDPDGIRFDLRVLDPKPMLTSLCLDNLTNEMSDIRNDRTINKMKHKVPIPLRKALENLLEWKKDAS